MNYPQRIPQELISTTEILWNAFQNEFAEDCPELSNTSLDTAARLLLEFEDDPKGLLQNYIDGFFTNDPADAQYEALENFLAYYMEENYAEEI